MTPRVQLAPGRWVGEGEPPFVIAEAGVNHNGDPALALQLVDAAAEAGADAVKFQTFQTDHLVSPSARKASYQAETTGADEPQAAMLRRLELSREAHRDLLARCEQRGLVFLSSPFDTESLTFLSELPVPALKLGSGEVTHHRLVRAAAETGLPVILSTGMATLTEVEAAVATFHAAGGSDLVLLHCVSAYPTPPAEVNLRALATLAQAFRVPVGFSDHTAGTAVSIAAAALGAAVLEKHFTLDRALPGPDHRASLEPAELAALVAGARDAAAARGDGEKRPMPSEADTRAVARRSLAAARDLPAGTTLTAADLIALRPEGGFSPTDEAALIGRTTARAYARGELFDPEGLN